MSDRELDERQATVYEIEGRQHVRASPGFTEAITRAHAAQQRPRCVCVPGGLETYIAKLADYYVIKRMPGTGHLHAASCPHFEPTANESGLRPLLGTACQATSNTAPLTTSRTDPLH